MTTENEHEATVSSNITLTKIEPGGENKPGLYWTFDDTEEVPEEEVLWAGPFETEQLALENATEALGAAYAAAAEQLLGGK